MTANADDPEQVLEAWRAGRVERRDLYAAVRASMWQGARRGISWITSTKADDADVEDVVYDSFCEFERQIPNEMKSLRGFAARIAFQRGRDRGRAILRDRKKLTVDLADPSYKAELEFADVDAQLAERRAVLADLALECLDTLTAEQRSVVKDTIMAHMSLSDWALREGKSHQAASRQRSRAVDSLRRCVDHKMRNQNGEKEDGDE
jgi:DNA-directed RNA polymerase specialized sigma24 family protein